MEILYAAKCECGVIHGDSKCVMGTDTPEAAIYAALQNGWGLDGCSMVCPECLKDCENVMDRIVTMKKETDDATK